MHHWSEVTLPRDTATCENLANDHGPRTLAIDARLWEEFGESVMQEIEDKFLSSEPPTVPRPCAVPYRGTCPFLSTTAKYCGFGLPPIFVDPVKQLHHPFEVRASDYFPPFEEQRSVLLYADPNFLPVPPVALVPLPSIKEIHQIAMPENFPSHMLVHVLDSPLMRFPVLGRSNAWVYPSVGVFVNCGNEFTGSDIWSAVGITEFSFPTDAQFPLSDPEHDVPTMSLFECRTPEEAAFAAALESVRCEVQWFANMGPHWDLYFLEQSEDPDGNDTPPASAQKPRALPVDFPHSDSLVGLTLLQWVRTTLMRTGVQFRQDHGMPSGPEIPADAALVMKRVAANHPHPVRLLPIGYSVNQKHTRFTPNQLACEQAVRQRLFHHAADRRMSKLLECVSKMRVTPSSSSVVMPDVERKTKEARELFDVLLAAHQERFRAFMLANPDAPKVQDQEKTVMDAVLSVQRQFEGLRDSLVSFERCDL